MTRTAVLTWIRPTVVDVQLAILALETFRALALIRSYEIFAGRTVLAGRRVAFVDFLLAIGAGVTLEAVATMAIANVLASAVVTEDLLLHALANGGVLARDHLHVAHLAGPSGRTDAVILVLMLHACCLILARIVRAPVHELVASRTRESVRAMARIVLHVIVASGAVQARRTVALVDAILTIGTRVTGIADTRIVVDTVNALAAVHATTVGAIFIVGLTIDAGEAELALTRVGVNVLLADGTVLTGLRQAFVDVDLAVFAAEAVHAQARVIADTVETGTAILAGDCKAAKKKIECHSATFIKRV